MYSFLIFYIGILLLLAKDATGPDGQEASPINNFQLGKVFLSIILAYSTTGGMGLWLALIGATKTKIVYIACTFLFISLILGSPRKAVANIYKGTRRMISHINANYSKKYDRWVLIFVVITIVVLYMVSVGPINHPDASDYHVGYPKQFLDSGFLLRDGGLHEGLLGVGDFSNIAFLQENTTWLIRSIQLAPLTPIVATFLVRGTSLLSISAFLTSFVFIGGWATIGKPLFLGEVCIAGMYLQYILIRSRENRQQLWITIMLAISIKVSTLLICIPVILGSMRKVFASKANCSNEKDASSRNKLVLYALSILTTILLTRYSLTGNPLYPFFSSLITPGIDSYERFEFFLKSYMREDVFFPLRIVIPKSLGLIGMTLGPSIIIIAAQKIMEINRTISNIRSASWVAIFQIVLLIAFAQGRADYYSCPLVLLVYGSNFGIHIYNFRQSAIRKITACGFCFIFIFQSFLFYILAAISIGQSITSLVNYEKAMRDFAYGYTESLYLNSLPRPRVNILSRSTRLYYASGYIDSDVFNNCLDISDRANLSFQAKVEQCILKLGVKGIIGNDQLESSKLLSCSISDAFTRASRNPFNSAITRLTICTTKPTANKGQQTHN